MATFIDSTHETLVTIELISSGCNALAAPFQQLPGGPMEVFLCGCVNDLRHSLFHLLNCLITTASEFRGKAKVTGSKFWTIGMVEMPLTQFEEYWLLPTESLPELT